MAKTKKLLISVLAVLLFTALASIFCGNAVYSESIDTEYISYNTATGQVTYYSIETENDVLDVQEEDESGSDNAYNPSESN